MWPTSTPPYNVVVNVNTGNTVKVPFNATIPGTLTFLSGDIDMSSFNLSIGSSTVSTNLGSIVEPVVGTAFINVLGNGNVRLTTGSLTRWFGTAALPIAATTADPNTGITSQGYFPISFGGSNRSVYMYFSAGNALTSGGSVTISHNPASGTSLLSPAVADGAYSINARTNASWTFTTSSSLALGSGGRIAIKATAGNLISPINVSQLRLTHQTLDPGANGGGGGGAPNYTSVRNSLLISDLTNGPWYFGANTADLNTGANGVYTAITTGNWTTASTWDIGVVPTGANLAVINPGVTTTVNSATCAAKALTVLGTLNVNTTGTALNVDSELINNGIVSVNGGTLSTNVNGTANAVQQVTLIGIYNYGSFLLNGGTVNIGPINGGNKPFQNFGGLTVGSGTMNINGSFASLAGSFFTQSGGSITVDGNTGDANLMTRLNNSVPHGRALFSLATPAINLWGGNINIIDPHADTTNGTNPINWPVTFEYVSPISAVYNDSSAHTITFGNGISTDPGGNPRGFYINAVSNSGVFNFSNMIVNGALGVNRQVTTASNLGVQRALTINSGGEYQTYRHDLVLNGNLTVNTGGRLTTDNNGVVVFGQLKFVNGSTSALEVPAAPVAPPQTLSGTGLFVNTDNTIANFGSIKVMSPPYVVFNTGANVIYPSTDMLTFTPVNNVPSRIIMLSGNLAETGALGSSNNASANNGWVVGGYQKHAVAATNMPAASYTYPIGDSSNYTPVSLNSTTVNVITTGDIAVRTAPRPSINLPFSTFNPLALVNRTYTITASLGLSLRPNSVSAVFNWVPSDVSPGANYLNFKVGVNPSGTAWYYPHSTPISATSITLDSLAPTGLTGIYQIGEGCPPTVITSQPLTTSACIGGAPITFTVRATGASLQYQWYHNNVAIPGANASVYNKPLPTISDAGSYFVVITGACAAPDTSNTVQAQLGGPAPITVQPQSKAVCSGGPVTICVTAVGNGLTYRWQKNGADIPNSLNASCITIPSLSILDTGRYRVIIGTGCANDTSIIAVISILPLPTAFVTVNTPLAFCAGGNVLLSANIAAGYNYQWSVGGTQIPGATNAVYNAILPGRYTVNVTDANSCSATSAVDSVTVFPGPPATVTSLGQNTFCAGGSVVLSANYNPSYSYQWQLNGTNITGSSSQNYSASGTGNYSVKVTNIQNCSTTSAAVAVNALTIPSGQVATSGSTVLCSGSSVQLAAPTGTNYTYQWYNSGVQIPYPLGTNATYTANTVGAYSVVISDGSCLDTTAPVNVTSVPLPASTIIYNTTLTFCEGGNVVLSAGTGTGLTYQWLKDGNNTNVTSASYTATASGNYAVTITNSGGCSETTVPVTVTVNALPAPSITYAMNGVLSTQYSPDYSYQWFENNTRVPANGNSSTYVTTSNGLYTVFVTDRNGCSNMSAAFNFQGTGVSGVSAQHIRVYPNPAKDVVFIEAPFTVNVSLNSIDGKQLLNMADAKSINISNLASGIYMIRISDVDGNLISVQKLVKADN